MVGGDEDTALERLGETLTPILNPWGLPEWAKLRGEQLYSVRSFQAAVAAEFSGIALHNPAGSNTIIVVDAVAAGAGTTMTVLLEIMLDSAISATYTVNANPASLRDRRFRTSFSAVAQVRQGSDATNTFGAQLDTTTAPTLPSAGSPSDFRALPVILQPGEALAVIGQTVNLSLVTVFVWRERAALPGELV